MIYQFKGGPLDGGEFDIPEMDIGEIFRHPIPNDPDANLDASNTAQNVDFLTARYRVTCVGEMAFDCYAE